MHRLPENERKSPDFQVQRRPQETAQRERLGSATIGTVPVDPPHEEGAFPAREETPRLMRLVWELHDEEVAGEANAARDLRR